MPENIAWINVYPFWEEAGKTDKAKPSRFFKQKRIRSLFPDIAKKLNVSVEQIEPTFKNGEYWVIAEFETLYREWLKGGNRSREQPLKEPEVSETPNTANSQKQQKQHKKNDRRTSKEDARKTNPMFSPETALFLLESTEPYPVDLDDAIAWWDCRTKDGKPLLRHNLVRKLKRNYYEGVNFTVIKIDYGEKRPSGRFIAAEKIFLSIECFKMMGMQVSGERGDQIRRYFLDCETELKRRLKEDENKKQWKVIKACVLPEPRKWEQMFPKEFWDKTELVTGKPQPVCAWLIGLIYSHRFPKGVHKHITGKNPRNEKGNRRYKTHQFLTEEIGLVALDMFKAQVVAVLDISPIGNYSVFRKNLIKVFSSTIQLELPLFDEEAFLSEAIPA